MPCANRHFLPGCVWHITHRCHRKSFLLKFARDRAGFGAGWIFIRFAQGGRRPRRVV